MEGGGLYTLPEGCIAHVISLTSPRDSCMLALVSSTFRSAAESDTVWERFLPSDYPRILARAVHPLQFSTKRDLYFALCTPILIDAGNMSFALERSSGRKCYTISARELGIIWGDTPHYWRWIPLVDSRFADVAELLNVCWLEIYGKIDSKVLSPNTSYTAYLLFKLTDGSRGLTLPDQETSVMVGTHESRRRVCLQPVEAEMQQSRHMLRRFMNWRGMVVFQQPRGAEEARGDVGAPHAREDGWMEMELGEFFNDVDGDDGEVYMSFTEVKGGHWKSGLIVQGIEVRPKK